MTATCAIYRSHYVIFPCVSFQNALIFSVRVLIGFINIDINRCSYDYNSVPLIFFPDNFFYRECNGGPDVGYEDGCVYYVLVEQDSVTSSIMYGTYPLTEVV